MNFVGIFFNLGFEIVAYQKEIFKALVVSLPFVRPDGEELRVFIVFCRAVNTYVAIVIYYSLSSAIKLGGSITVRVDK